MRQKYWTRISRGLLVFAVIGVVSYIPSIASASCTLVGDQQTCSNNYAVGQTVFNSGGVNQCPLHTGSGYCANESVGDLSDGNISDGSHFQAQTGSGFVTNRDPYIQMIIGGVPTNVGILKNTCTTVTTGNFSVKTYLASGYIVQTIGNAPTSGGSSPHTLSVPSTPTTPTVGSEMFGMNLVSNTGMSPANCDSSTSVGANPLQVPGGTFSFGAAATSAQNGNSDSYNQAGKFMYHNGDVVAYSNQSSGETDYTVSYAYDISGLTPSGQYNFNDVFVATSTY